MATENNSTTEQIKEVIAEVVKENLTTEGEAEMLEEGIVEFTTAGDYINSAYFALSAVDDIDTAIISKEAEKRIKRIKRKSIKIIDICITEMYDELFDTDEDD
jgi:bacterioferritin (cytochrome b1)